MTVTKSQNPAGYVGILSILVDAARPHGYALGLHGSLARDMDLIAVPWVEDASPPGVLANALAERIAWVHEGIDGPVLRPHGRLSWSICVGFGAYIDLSVMPLAPGPDPRGET